MNVCLDSMSRGRNERVGATTCHQQGGNQIFQYTKSGEIRKTELCLNGPDLDEPILMVKCDTSQPSPLPPPSQIWDYDSNVRTNERRKMGFLIYLFCVAVSICYFTHLSFLL